ncbi:MAG: PLP-dependent transferase, partial [Vicinamibacterales bacterium]
MAKMTDLLRSSHVVPGTAAPLTTPIFETTTFLFDSAADVVAYNKGTSSNYLYTRYGNPTVVSVEQSLALLDQAERALLFSSGMAAIATTLLGHLNAGDEVLCAAAIYGGTLHLLEDLLSRFGVRTRFVSPDELLSLQDVIGERTRIVWFETPTNPTLRCVD